MNHLGAHAALKLRLRCLEGFDGCLLITGLERRLDLAHVCSHARKPRAIDRGAALGLTDALLRRLVMGHRLLAHGTAFAEGGGLYPWGASASSRPAPPDLLPLSGCGTGVCASRRR